MQAWPSAVSRLHIQLLAIPLQARDCRWRTDAIEHGMRPIGSKFASTYFTSFATASGTPCYSFDRVRRWWTKNLSGDGLAAESMLFAAIFLPGSPGHYTLCVAHLDQECIYYLDSLGVSPGIEHHSPLHWSANLALCDPEK